MNKKLYGSYNFDHYKYPNIRIDLVIERYYVWRNYDRIDGESMIFPDFENYYDTEVTEFKWSK